mgnify:CR=1 FL=1
MENQTKIPSSPWGDIQSFNAMAVRDDEDIFTCFNVSTASHGGLLIPTELAERRVPSEYLKRSFVKQIGAYTAFEEDCEWAFALKFIPELVPLFPGADDILGQAQRVVSYYTEPKLQIIVVK